jgi:hypothetical protein
MSKIRKIDFIVEGRPFTLEFPNIDVSDKVDIYTYEEDQKAISGILNIFNTNISWQDE